MEQSSLTDHVKLIYKFLTAKKPEWQSLADKVHLQFARNTLMLLMIVSITTYILSGKSLQNIVVVIVVNSLLLLLMHERTFIIMKLISIITCMGIPMVRYFLVGKETMLYNQVHISIASLSVLMFTGSYRLTSLCFVYIAFFSQFNTKNIIEEYQTSPVDFHQTLKYFLEHYHILNLLIWIMISLIVYQKQSLLAQLWMRQKEKEDLLAQLQSQNLELQKLNQSRTKLLLGLSHEFRNPINAALGNLELANEKVVDNSLKKYLTNCKVSIEMLFHLVSNLLDSTKLEAGVLEVNLLQKDSKAMFYKVWGIIKNLLDKQNLTGEFYIHKGIPRTLNIDSHFLVKILLNLILNAIKYTHEGAVMTVITWIDENTLTESMLQPTLAFYSKFQTTFSVKKKMLRLQQMTQTQSQGSYLFSSGSNEDIDVPLERTFETEQESFDDRLIHQPSMRLIDAFQNVSKHYEKLANKQESVNSIHSMNAMPEKRRYKSKGFLKIEVFDSGCGIDDQVQKTLFEKFSSLSIGADDRLGLGLGLWLTKNLCEILGGRVRAFSEKNKGSQFVAMIPAECLETSQMLDESFKTSATDPAKFGAKLTALVVDDDKYNREINSVFLGKAEVTVKAEAVNGQEAVDIFTSKPPNYFDMIIMDLEMPIMNGKEAVRRIRDFERLHRRVPVKVVIATGNCVATEYNECVDKNGSIKADFFYRKPLLKKDFEEFVEVMQREKATQNTCLIIKGDILLVEFLQAILKRHQIHVLSLDTIEEAETLIREGRVNVRWILMNLNLKGDAMDKFMKFVRNTSMNSRIIEVIGCCEVLTADEMNYCRYHGVDKVLHPPITQEEIKGLFHLESRG